MCVSMCICICVYVQVCTCACIIICVRVHVHRCVLVWEDERTTSDVISSSFFPNKIESVLIRITVAVVKYHDQSKLRRKGFIWPTYSESHFNKVGTVTRQEPWGGGLCRGYGGVLFIDLLLMACKVRFLIESWTTSPEVAPPTEKLYQIVLKLDSVICYST